MQKEETSSLFLAIIAVSILLSGPMIAGYAVLDEVGLYLLVAVVAAKGGHGKRDDYDRLERTHYMLFLAFTAYLAAQTIRGIFVLSDFRIIRFTLLFVSVGLVAFFVSRADGQLGPREQVARVVTIASIGYFLSYALAGMVTEWFAGGNRFDLQGYFWSGTATAILPVYALLPALLADARFSSGGGARLFWIGYFLSVFVAFYYQSRSAWLAVVLFLVLGAFALGPRRLVVAAGGFAAFVMLFPWHVEHSLTPANLAQDFSRSVGEVLNGDMGHKAARFAQALFGAFHSHTLLKVAVADAVSADAEKRESASQSNLSAALVPDLDRKVALLAAIHCLKNGGLLRWLFGTGYYTHRFELVSCVQAVAPRVGYVPPPGYAKIVRTATFGALLVDAGLLGVTLLAALFGLTAVQVLRSNCKHRHAILGSLVLVGFSTFVSLDYDAVLFYLMLMPGGILLALLSPSNLSRVPVSTKRCQ